MKFKDFLKEERGDAFVWVMILVGLALFGLIYGIMDPFMNRMLTEGVNSGIPSEQQSVESNLWNFLPLIVFGALIIWGFTESQRRRQPI